MDTLTIIDLPGKIHYNESVNEAEKIEKNLKIIFKEFLGDEESTICVVDDAAVDIKTSCSFKFEKQYDKLGNRTILCVTKIDKRPDTSFDGFMVDAKNNKISNVYFVKNRTQTEVNNEISFEETREIEKKFICENQFLEKIEDKHKGLKRMCECLVELQEKTIRLNLIKNYKNLSILLERKKQIKTSINIDFYSVRFLNTLDPSYQLPITIIKELIQNNKNINKNFFTSSILKNIDFPKIQEIYKSDEKLNFQALRI